MRPHMDLPLVPLKTFHLVVRHGSFTAAAQHLGITQPAVTQQIRRLEGALGLRLFQRDGRRIAPTEAGQTLAAFAQRIFHLVDAARDALEDVAELQTGHLRIGGSRTGGAHPLRGPPPPPAWPPGVRRSRSWSRCRSSETASSWPPPPAISWPASQF